MRNAIKFRDKAILSAVFLLGCPPVMANIKSRMFTYKFTGLEFIGYYLTQWIDTYMGYPFVVKASVAILILSIFMVILLSVALMIDKYTNSRRERFYAKLKNRYGEVLLKIFADKKNYTDEEVLEMTQFKSEGWKGWRMFYVGQLLVDLKSEVYDEYNFSNVEAVVRVFGLQEFVENEMTFGSFSSRTKSMQLSQFLMINIPESILVQLLNSESHTLRKEVRMFYLWLSDYQPFRFFTDPNVNYEYRPWDSLEVHHLLRARRRANKEIPSLVPVVTNCPDMKLKSCLIREVAYWGTYEDIVKIREYITNDELCYRRAAIECMGIAKFEYAEQSLEHAYSQQTEELKQATLYTILRIRSGKALPFYVGAYGEAGSATTKLAILMCMWWYNDESRDTFEILETTASENDMLLFKEVRAVQEDPTKEMDGSASQPEIALYN